MASSKQHLKRNSISFRTMLSEYNRSLMLIVDRDLLVANTVSRINQIVPVTCVVFFLQNSDTRKFFYAGGKQQNDETFRHVAFMPHSKLVGWLSVNDTVFRASHSDGIMSYFSEEEQSLISDTGIELIYSMKVMNRLSGFVFLGRREDGSDFSRQDIELLTMLFHQAAFALENTVLYEEQSARIKKMYRSDRLAILGQLAAGAAHEIRNPLTAIRSTVQYLGKSIREPEKKEMVNELMEEIDRINKIVQGMLSFSKPSKLELTDVNIEELLRQSLLMLRTTITEHQVIVNCNIHAKNTVIAADPVQLKQVFFNVILNAVESMTELPEKYLTLTIESGPPMDYRSRYLLVSVTDSGKGIGQPDIENVFNPFYTTKKDGTGLGLPISYGIINQHGGEMEINSLTGKGTTVLIKLTQLI